jgi:hypothetical protein
MRNLLVISNEGIDSWTDEMKKGWDKIKVIPFPKIPYGASETWIEGEADEFVMEFVGINGENSDFEYVYLSPLNTSMLFYNKILLWRYRYTTFVDPLYVPILDIRTLEPTGKMRFVRWLVMKTR